VVRCVTQDLGRFPENLSVVSNDGKIQVLVSSLQKVLEGPWHQGIQWLALIQEDLDIRNFG